MWRFFAFLIGGCLLAGYAFVSNQDSSVHQPQESNASLRLPSPDDFGSDIIRSEEASALDGARTKGDHTWIPVDKDWERGKGDLPGLILGIMENFEKAHRDLGVTSWSVEKQSFEGWSHVLGIWVNHRRLPKYEILN